MDWMIAIATLAVFAFGYMIMNKLDQFIASPHFFPDRKPSERENNAVNGALVFGRFDLSDEIIELLKKLKIPYVKITDFNQLDQSMAYEYLFAVDESDFENLMICTVCEKVMGLKNRIAICSCFDNIKIFKDNHIPYLCGYSISAASLVAELIPSFQEAEEG